MYRKYADVYSINNFWPLYSSDKNSKKICFYDIKKLFTRPTALLIVNFAAFVGCSLNLMFSLQMW